VAYVFNAQLEPQADGTLVFRMDPLGESAQIYWNLDAADDPKPGTYKGDLAANPGGPPFCNCPDKANTCQCVITPNALHLSLRR
jgi:hypothetical protein